MLLSLYKCKESLSVRVCVSNISAHQDQTDLRVSTWLLRGSRVCNDAIFWTTVIPLIKSFINAYEFRELCPPEPPQSHAHQSQSLHTVAMCTPEPITAELKPMTYLKKEMDLYLQRRQLDRDFASGSVPLCASKLTVVD